jgi:hypothetical protein
MLKNAFRKCASFVLFEAQLIDIEIYFFENCIVVTVVLHAEEIWFAVSKMHYFI